MAVDLKPRDVVTPERDRPFVSVVFGVILLAVGVVWLLDAVDLVDLRPGVVLPAALTVVGLALVVGSFDGPHGGLVTFGVFLTVAVVVSSFTPFDSFRGGVGERNYRVLTQADLQTEYRVGVGDLEIDLSDLRMTESATVRGSVGAGTLRVVLPDDVPVSIDASTGAGQVDLLGETADGLSVSRTYESSDFDDADVWLRLVLDVATGEIEVDR